MRSGQPDTEAIINLIKLSLIRDLGSALFSGTYPMEYEGLYFLFLVRQGGGDYLVRHLDCPRISLMQLEMAWKCMTIEKGMIVVWGCEG